MTIKKVLFICTGNTCRSPLAESLLRHRVGSELDVQSAGVYASLGGEASVGTKEVLDEKGITHNHCSQPVTKELLDWADIIFTMTRSHKQIVEFEYPDYKEKLHTLKEFTDNDGLSSDINDPFGGTLDDYVTTAQEIEQCLEVLEKKIQSK